MKNMRRAANRRATTSMTSGYSGAAGNSPGNGAHTPMKSYGSPASLGGSIGPGPVAGAGELPGRGPGAAASRYAPRDPSETPIAKTPGPPSGVSVYKAGNPPPRGYRQ